MTEGALALKTKGPVAETESIDKIVIGKDVLELVSSAMYVDPLTIYREYVQNAADAIDEALAAGLYGRHKKGLVTISIDSALRKVTIRDDGIGVPWQDFARCMTSLGASGKRGGVARGFRGVGRLAGLGYAQRLTFRSRAQGESRVSELNWDCRLLRSVLRSSDPDAGIEDLIRRSVSLSRIPADGYPSRFFEVELDGVVRLRSDKLMSPTAIAEYLSQVAPVPFSPEFPFAEEIRQAVEPAVKLDTFDLRVSGVDGAIYRPHRRGFTDEKKQGKFEGLEIFTIPDVDGNSAAIGWLLHHEYDGAVPTATGFKGVRLRVGNVQIGGNALLEELFTEPRFNSWSIGEVHILDRRIIPNARRDDFEQNAHYSNLLNQVTPIARAISKRCRTSSKRRQLLRDFELQEQGVKERLHILKQGGIRKEARRGQSRQIEHALNKMRRLANAQEVDSEKDKLGTRILKIEERVREATRSLPSSPLDVLPPAKRGMYGQMIELIYECSTNRVAAKSLVDRILEKIALSDEANTGTSAKSLKRSKNSPVTVPRNSKTRAKKRGARETGQKARRPG
ncbi:MAG: hypothetical protein QOI12_4009 [Alphaproteobacteria bacterium]|jgi:molecular chaperone HtpG|nr:hypothetical protein [Alphaproteobacteria bacterium]